MWGTVSINFLPSSPRRNCLLNSSMELRQEKEAHSLINSYLDFTMVWQRNSMKPFILLFISSGYCRERSRQSKEKEAWGILRVASARRELTNTRKSPFCFRISNHFPPKQALSKGIIMCKYPWKNFLGFSLIEEKWPEAWLISGWLCDQPSRVEDRGELHRCSVKHGPIHVMDGLSGRVL